MPVQVIDRSHVARTVANKVNRATSIFFSYKLESDEHIQTVAPLNFNIPDLRDLIKFIEGEIAFRQKNQRDRISFAEKGLRRLQGSSYE